MTQAVAGSNPARCTVDAPSRPRGFSASSEPSRIVKTHYCVVRSDLARGTLAAQLIHAAGESAPGSLEPGTRAVALAVSNERELLTLEAALLRLSCPHVAIREPDPPWMGALMAIGIVPVVDRKPLRKVLGGLALLK